MFDQALAHDPARPDEHVHDAYRDLCLQRELREP
jgi:hypothetical protein